MIMMMMTSTKVMINSQSEQVEQDKHDKSMKRSNGELNYRLLCSEILSNPVTKCFQTRDRFEWWCERLKDKDFPFQVPRDEKDWKPYNETKWVHILQLVTTIWDQHLYTDSKMETDDIIQGWMTELFG